MTTFQIIAIKLLIRILETIIYSNVHEDWNERRETNKLFDEARALIADKK